MSEWEMRGGWQRALLEDVDTCECGYALWIFHGVLETYLPELSAREVLWYNRVCLVIIHHLNDATTVCQHVQGWRFLMAGRSIGFIITVHVVRWWLPSVTDPCNEKRSMETNRKLIIFGRKYSSNISWKWIYYIQCTWTMVGRVAQSA
jgi:hypothetical protein